MKNATKRRKQAMREATSNVAFNIKLAKIQQELDPDGHPNSPAYGHLKLPHLN